jgi:plastocyanin
MERMNSLLRPVLWLIALVCMLVALSILAHYLPTASSQGAVPRADSHPDIPPPPTPEEMAMLEEGKVVAALVSYTDQGFKPATTTVAVGDTVRFFNSSSNDMWVAATGSTGAVYPPGENDCGQSAFDMCHTVSRLHYWQFTFDTAGTWGYRNNAHAEDKGVVVVE